MAGIEKLIIEAGKQAPEVLLDYASGDFRIVGKSFPENAEKFYLPVLVWFAKLPGVEATTGPRELHFRLDYINSSSIFSILELLKLVREANVHGHQFAVVWQFDEADDDIRRIGQDYAMLTDLDFRMMVIEADY